MNLFLICFLWWRWHNGQKIGYDKSFSIFYLFLFITDWYCMGQYFFFCSCRIISLAYCFGEMTPVTAIMGEIYSWFITTDNDLLHASGNSAAYKIEQRITFALSHAHLYLSESDDELDDKSAAANTLYISCGGGRSISSLSDITVSVSATSNVFCCWIFTSYRFLPNDPLSSDDMVEWDNYSMLIIGGGDKNIYKGSLVLHNSW